MLFKISRAVDASSGQQGAQQANIISRFDYLDWKQLCLVKDLAVTQVHLTAWFDKGQFTVTFQLYKFYLSNSLQPFYFILLHERFPSFSPTSYGTVWLI